MAFMVIGSHGGFLREFGHFARYIYVSGIVRIAVPIFLITNGYFFYKSVYRDPSKWLIRAAKLYIVWMLIYAYYWMRIDAYNVRSLCKLAAIIIMGYGHLWYISAMIGAAVMVLLLRIKMSDCGMMLIAFGLFFCGVLIQYIGNCHVFQGSFIDTPSTCYGCTGISYFLAFRFLFLAF